MVSFEVKAVDHDAILETEMAKKVLTSRDFIEILDPLGEVLGDVLCPIMSID